MVNQPTIQDLAAWRSIIASRQKWQLLVKVTANCPHRGWRGQLADGRWKVGLNEPAVDNRANRALLVWLSQELDCPVGRLAISHGQTSSLKTIVAIN